VSDQPAGDQVARPPVPEHPYPLLASVLGQLGYGRDLFHEPPPQPAPHEHYIAARFVHPLAEVSVRVSEDEPVGNETRGPVFVSWIFLNAHRPGWKRGDSPRWSLQFGPHVPLHLVRHIAAAAAQGE
jgi:hypothetical protein